MNLNDYRTTYHAESWENVAKVNGIMCAPIGAVRAVNALCDDIEVEMISGDVLYAAPSPGD